MRLFSSIWASESPFCMAAEWDRQKLLLGHSVKCWRYDVLLILQLKTVSNPRLSRKLRLRCCFGRERGAPIRSVRSSPAETAGCAMWDVNRQTLNLKNKMYNIIN